MKLDLTIGQRLAIGFALMMVTLAGLLISVGQAHQASAEAQAAFTRHIAPLTEQAISLERAVYGVAIAQRNYLINADDPNLMEYRLTAENAQTALRTLHDTPKSGTTEALYRDVGVLVRSYLRQVDRAVEERREHRLGERSERLLNGARERAVTAIHDFSDHQAANTRAALSGMTYARERVSRDLLIASLVALGWFFVIALGTARSVSKPARELVKVARGFERGLWKPALAWARGSEDRAVLPEPRDEMAKLRRAIGAAAAALEKREQRFYADAQVASATAASLDRDEIGDRVLLAIVEQIHAEAAVVYVRSTEAETLDPIATYALLDEIKPVHIGDGVPGEAVRTGRPVVVRDIPSDIPFRIKLGVDEASPKTIAAIPILFRREAIGVIVVASLHELDDDDIAFLRIASGQLAIGLRNATAHEQVQRLLAAVREKNEQIAAQNAHLQAQNEEIQAQSEEIQAQSEEISARNEQLREQAEELRTQAADLAQAGGRKKPRTERRVVDFAAVVKNCIRDQQPLFDEGRVILKTHLPGLPVWVAGDENRLSHGVANLLVNAFKFSQREQAVTVSLKLDSDRAQAVLQVGDESAGLDPAFMPRLFDPFTQTTECAGRSDGIGMGLAMVRAPTQLHGDRGGATTEGSGESACFMVRLPAVQPVLGDVSGRLEVALERYDR